MKKIILIFIMIYTCSFFTGCMSDVKNGNVVNITLLNSKPEIQVELEKAIKEFEKENPDIKIKSIKYSENSTYSNKLKSLYATGNAPTISILEGIEIGEFNKSFSNLSNEPWTEEVSKDDYPLAYNEDGEVIALPFAIEAMGLIYNKKVLDQAGIDIKSINTTSALEEAFKKIEAIGKKGVIISNEIWSLGNHLFPTAFATKSKDVNEVLDYFNAVKLGKEKLDNNSNVNGLLDTFDLMKKYNQYSDAPLSPSYDRCVESLANGEVGFWYMGNWASNLLLSANSSNTDYGFAPVPVSNNASDYGNNEIVLGTTKYIVIDKDNNSEEQQEAAKRFLNWLVTDEKGKDYVVNKFKLIPALESFDVEFQDSLSAQMEEYRKSNLTLELMIPYLPEDNSENTGALMKEYLSGKIDRKTLLDSIQKYLESK